MRLFIGAGLEESIKSKLNKSIEELKSISKGNFVSQKNLHVTIQFLGEKNIEDIGALSRAIEKGAAFTGAINAALDKPGRFSRGKESIVWYGLKGEISQLFKLHESICGELSNSKITFDKKDFNPHITLGRRVISNLSWEEVFSRITVDEKPFTISSVTLFESVRINGVLTYIPVYDKSL